MKINAIQLNKGYQVPFRANAQDAATLPTQTTADSTQFKRNISQAQGGEAKALRKVLTFFKPRAATENKKQYNNDEVKNLIDERMWYI